MTTTREGSEPADWVPTTEEVREAFADDYWAVTVRGNDSEEERLERGRAFDRWLGDAVHKECAEAWLKGLPDAAQPAGDDVCRCPWWEYHPGAPGIADPASIRERTPFCPVHRG